MSRTCGSCAPAAAALPPSACAPMIACAATSLPSRKSRAAAVAASSAGPAFLGWLLTAPLRRGQGKRQAREPQRQAGKVAGLPGAGPSLAVSSACMQATRIHGRCILVYAKPHDASNPGNARSEARQQ